MRILVDTSVWVDFFNDHPSKESSALARFIQDHDEIATCGVVGAEVVQGFRDARTLRGLEPYFREMAWLAPAEPDTYLAAARLFRDLRAKGITIRSTIDCLIVRLADEHDHLVLARDRDLRAILD